MSSATPVKTILILSANPKGTKSLRLDEEIREIKDGLLRAKIRDQFFIEAESAVRSIDIHRALLKVKPQIVHFSGHGAGEEGLVFEDEIGQEKLVNAEALANLFELFAGHVECVLLNACYSEIQAKAIAQHIDYVIGMSQEIGDKAAIKFAVSFYDALGAGESIEFAFKLGCSVIQVEGISENLVPKLLSKKQFGWERSRDQFGDQKNGEGLSPLDKSRSFTDSLKSPPHFSKPCLGKQSNIKSESLTDDLSSERGLDYTRLRDLLANRNWEEADRETAQVMLKAVGREQEGWLRKEDIETFPCTDLSSIDTLWIKYSKGHFGFSVQKCIWLEVGGKVDEKTELRLGNRVGWFRKDDWLKYSEVTFSLNAPQGHLPVRLVGIAPSWELIWGSGKGAVPLCLVHNFSRPLGWVWCWAGLHLFSRVETCKL